MRKSPDPKGEVENTVAETSPSPDNMLARLLVGSDYSQPLSEEDRAWIDAPSVGRLVQCDPTGIVIHREGDRCGAVAVHFPRLGQMVLPA